MGDASADGVVGIDISFDKSPRMEVEKERQKSIFFRVVETHKELVMLYWDEVVHHLSQGLWLSHKTPHARGAPPHLLEGDFADREVVCLARYFDDLFDCWMEWHSDFP